MNRCLRRVVFPILFVCLVFCLAQTAMAAEVLKTTDIVNLRAGPSTDSSVIRTLGNGTNVDVLEHDPAGWSKVSVSGDLGYVRSDFLALPAGSAPAVFKTTDGVNLRSGPSTDSSVVRTVIAGTNVSVLEHNPAGWSKVSIDGSVGYIRSDFLARPIQGQQQATAAPSASQAQSAQVYSTTDGVNFRTGPSTDASKITALAAGTLVNMLDHDPDGWSKVIYNGTTGYIKSEYLRKGSGKVELLDWSVAKNVVPTGTSFKVVDVRTGLSYNIKCFSKGGHCDVEPVTADDTATILTSRNGVWAWDPRPVWVYVGDRVLAASLNGQPHDVSNNPNNNMNGHLCLHFNNTVTNNKSYQNDLNKAVVEAWNAAQ